eukprot:3651284-Rhodomonas_salina.1
MCPSRAAGTWPPVGFERLVQVAVAMSYSCKSLRNGVPPPARRARTRVQTDSGRAQTWGELTLV